MATLPNTWRRREPEGTVLYQVLGEHLDTFLARIADDDTRAPLPRFVVRELRNFLDCGQLSRGFCRVHCDACGKGALVAFSCKHRGFCPSCGSRRMADTAAWLVDRVFPDVPVRQWVLSLPYHIRFLCAFDPKAARGVRKILVRCGLRRPRRGVASSACHLRSVVGWSTWSRGSGRGRSLTSTTRVPSTAVGGELLEA